MKKLILLVPILLVGVFFLFQSKKPPQQPTSMLSPTIKEVNITASFEIYTQGTKRIFTDTKYHNRSEDVYITAEDPSLIYLKKEGVTWQDFFNTMPAPMKVTKECLYTGTGQQFCSGSGSALKFYLNDQEDPQALDKEIQKDDKLLLEFK